MKIYKIKPAKKSKKKQKGGFINTIGKLKSYYDMYNHGRSIYNDGKNIVNTLAGKNSFAKKLGTTVEGVKRISENIKGLKSANQRRKYWGGGKKLVYKHCKKLKTKKKNNKKEN